MPHVFTELRIWQKAHELTLRVYKVTESFPREETYGLTSQLRRAAVSVEANIAEGHGRYHYAEEVNFLLISRGSSSEAQTLLFVARDLKYLAGETADTIIEEYALLSKQISSYIRVKRGALRESRK